MRVYGVARSCDGVYMAVNIKILSWIAEELKKYAEK